MPQGQYGQLVGGHGAGLVAPGLFIKPGLVLAVTQLAVGPSCTLSDTVRQQAIATLMATLKGRENEPAGVVFKNVKLHKDLPVKDFLAMMDEQYGRGLGFTCVNCHMDNGDYASDTRKNKVIARQMERMQRDIDAKYINKVKELDDPRPKTTCVMCHRGTPHMPNTMDVPTAPVPQRKRG
jgi:hypothetical protein